MRTLAVALAALAAVGCGVARCKAGSVLLSLALDNGAEAADAIDVALSIDGAPAQTKTVAHTPGSRAGTIEIDFSAAYPTGRTLDLTLTARAGGAALASVGDRITAAAGCSNDSLTLDGAVGVADMADGDLGGVDLGPPAFARPIAPLSTATVSSQRPTLRWSLGAGGGTPAVELCQDRGCTMPLAITTTVGAGNDRAVPDAPLPHGWVFWRVRVTFGGQTSTSATWQFWVGVSGTSVDTSSGTILDVNGDGFADYLVGDGAKATVHLYLGNGGGGAMPSIDITNPDGAGSNFGASVASAGDVNGDGFADFLVGAVELGGSGGPGAAHLFFGEPTPSATDYNGAGAPRRIDLAGPDAGVAAYGDSTRSAGDVDGDGYADFLVGAGNDNIVHVYFGSATPSAADWAAAGSPRRIDVISPDDAAGQFGATTDGAGDVNGDGFGDFLVGALKASTGAGAAHLYYGSATPTAAGWNGTAPAARVDLTTPDGASATFGGSVSRAGDINNDGYTDFLVGAVNAGSNAGIVHLYFGSASPTASGWNGATPAKRIDVTTPDGNFSRFGSVAGGGDVNGDGYADFLVGAYAAPQGATSPGAAHLYLGESSPFAGDWNGASPGRRIDLAAPETANQSDFGETVAIAGDINGDGFAEFFVCSPNAAASSGAVHLYFGKSAPAAADYNGATPPKRTDIADPDGASAQFGYAVY